MKSARAAQVVFLVDGLHALDGAAVLVRQFKRSLSEQLQSR